MKTRSVKIILMVATVLGAGLFSSCSKDDDAAPVVKTELVASVTAANLLLSTTIEGVGTGNYLKGSKAPLETAVAAAQAVVDDAAATQAVVTNATVALAAAVTIYEGQKVVPIDPTNLVAQWTFDQIAAVTIGSLVKDYSGNARDGAIKAGHAHWGAGVPTLAADRYGVAGKALHFDDGANVEIPYNTALNPPAITVSLWMKQDVNNPIVNDQYMIAMNRWNGYKFNMQNVPKPFFTVNPQETPGSYYNEDSADPVAGLAQGAWHHLVVTFGGGHMIFYIDGVMTKDWAHTGTIINMSANPVNLTIGQDLPTSKYTLTSGDFFVDWGGHFIGALDEVRIYKVALSASQVTSIYNVEKP